MTGYWRIIAMAGALLLPSSCDKTESNRYALETEIDQDIHGYEYYHFAFDRIYGLEDFPKRINLKQTLCGLRESISETEQLMIMHGLVDIQEVDSSIVVELKYATTDNFLGKDVYGGMRRAYLQPEVADMLVVSQQYLQRIRPGFSLIVYDAARPRSVQQLMWDLLDAPFEEKIRFLSNPQNGSIHNFGAAVDVSILYPDGEPLDMGTPFDFLGPLAYPSLEAEMLDQGLLSEKHVVNRQLLRHVMRHGGFWGIQSEWWHFNAFNRAQARERFEIIE